MFELDTNRRILQIFDGTFDNSLSCFITDRRSRQLSPRTIDYYQEKLSAFSKFICSQGIENLCEITAEVIRLYLLNLSSSCNNGGIHAHYRALRSFFNGKNNPQTGKRCKCKSTRSLSALAWGANGIL